MKIIKKDKVKIYIDGGSRGNPGPGGAGVLIKIGRKAYKLKAFFQKCTNNQAEYQALILALKWLKKRKETIPLNVEITVYSDSLLLVKQVRAEFKVRNKGLKILHKRAKALLNIFPHLKFQHIKRGKNQIADNLVNQILDKKTKI